VFVNSMSDLFHESVPFEFIDRVFAVMALCPQHTFQILTKRPERWGEVSREVLRRWECWPRHILPGTSIETARYLPRLEALAQAGDNGTVRMVSVEPLLESLVGDDGVEALAGRLHAARVGWVISGGESGWSARPASLDWFRELRDACSIAGIPYFHKQHGGRGTDHKAKRSGEFADLDGVIHQARPSV